MITLVRERATPTLGTPRRSPAMLGEGQNTSPVMWGNGVTANSSVSDRWATRRCVARDTTAGFSTPQARWGPRIGELAGFSTPQRVTVMGREQAFFERRSATNHWGAGGSPLLSVNVPKESLQESYLKFNNLHSDSDDYEVEVLTKISGDVARKRRGWLSSMMRWKKKEKKAVVGASERKKSSWMKGSRWPQGWH